MNPRQFAQQIKSKLEAAVWPLGAGDVVFGTKDSVIVFAGAPTADQLPTAQPFALVGVGSGTPDPDDPQLILQQFEVSVGTVVMGDPMGEQALTGGPIANLGKSAGRGVMEISARARAAVEDMTGADGGKILVSNISMEPPFTIGAGKHVAGETFTLEALCTSNEHYNAPQLLRFAGGTWTWDGPICSGRYDFFQFRLIEKDGATAPTTPADGTAVYTGTLATTTNGGSSGKAYTIFADYNARGASSIENTSTNELGTSVVIV